MLTFYGNIRVDHVCLDVAAEFQNVCFSDFLSGTVVAGLTEEFSVDWRWKICIGCNIMGAVSSDSLRNRTSKTLEQRPEIKHTPPNGAIFPCSGYVDM